MKKLIALVLIVVASLIAVPASTLSVRGQSVGLVCIAATGSTSCPNGIPSFNGAQGSQLTVTVFLQGSDPIGGFDIFVKTINSVLNPSSASLSGSLITSPTFTTECINGVAVQGSCSSPANGLGVVEVSTIDSSGNNVCSAPCTGLLFSITYNIVGTGTTDISYPSDPSCSPSSVSGSDTCILVFDNIGNVDNENVQIGTFANGPPDFSVTAIPDSLTVFQGSSSTSQVVVSSTGGYSGPVSLTSTVSPVVTNGPTSSLSTNSVTLTPGSSSTVILTVSASLSTPTGSYNVTVTGTGGSISHSKRVAVSVQAFSGVLFYGKGLNGLGNVNITATGGLQIWTAHLDNRGVVGQSITIRISGTSSAGPYTQTFSTSLSFTGKGTLTFNTPVSSKYVGSRITYTATLFFGASQTQSPTSASGSFKVSQ